jgi:hypothetical protein
MRPWRKWHDGKEIHKSKGKAEAALRALFARGERKGEAALKNGGEYGELGVYRCLADAHIHGAHWHVGHRAKRRRRKRKEA